MNNKSQNIYISGPYSATSQEGIQGNVDIAMTIGLRVFKMGHYPFVPHLVHYMHIFGMKYQTYIDYEGWMDYVCRWLPKCDSILHYESSPGADRELELAKELKLNIYHTIEEIPVI